MLVLSVEDDRLYIVLDNDGDVDVGVGINSIHVCQYDFLVGNI